MLDSLVISREGHTVTLSFNIFENIVFEVTPYEVHTGLNRMYAMGKATAYSAVGAFNFGFVQLWFSRRNFIMCAIKT